VLLAYMLAESAAETCLHRERSTAMDYFTCRTEMVIAMTFC